MFQRRRYSSALVAALITATGCAGSAPPGAPSTAAVSAERLNAGTAEQTPLRPAKARAGVRIAAAGDIACEPPYTVTRRRCRQGATARLILSHSEDAVLPLGDTQYESGRFADYRTSYDRTWGAFKRVSYPVIGNHEYRDRGANGFLSYFGTRVPNARGWYASNVGTWRIYALNSNCSKVSCAAQVRWLKSDLVAHPRRCSLAAMHHPRFSSGEHGNSAWAARLWRPLDTHQVDLVLAGHDHDYERFAPRHSSGVVAPNGLRSFVVGTGGKSLYAFKAIKAGSRSRYAASAGVLFLTLRDADYTWRFRTTDGTVRDSGTASCLR